jgi:hypothetical protein
MGVGSRGRSYQVQNQDRTTNRTRDEKDDGYYGEWGA